MDIKRNTLAFPRAFELRKSADFIILHHAAASIASLEDIHHWHLEKGWNGIGYNFYVRKDGTVYEGRPLWAADADAYGHNYDSLSICFEGDYMTETMGEVQIVAGIKLIRHLRSLYPSTVILRHKDVNSDTNCPGINFPDRIKKEGAKIVETAQEAIAALTNAGVIHSPEYWIKAVTVVIHLDQLLINMANTLSK